MSKGKHSIPAPPPLSHEERLLFRESVGPVKRLYSDRVPPVPARLPPYPLQTRRDEEQVLKDLLSEQFDPAEMETGDELIYLRPGVRRKVLRKLRRGQFSVHAQLDLHGMTVREAREALAEFLREARLSNRPCVRIVHGKGLGSPRGQPVLKQKLNHWLRQRDDVLAFCSARPVDGGTGAVYLLLKR